MAKLPRIPTPFSHHLRRFRFQVLPVLVFFGVLAVTLMLWDHQRTRQWASGGVEAMSVELAFTVDGMLVPVPLRPTVMDSVRAGDIVAQLDPEPISQELEAMLHELDRLRAELDAVAATLRLEETARQYDRLMDRRRLALDVERHQLELLDRRARVQTHRIELLRYEAEYEAVRRAFERGVETEYIVENRRLRRDSAAQLVEGEEAAIEEAEAQLAQLRRRLSEQRDLDEPETRIDTLLSPIRHAIDAQVARIRMLELQSKAMSIASPINGVITAVNYQPGQAVRAGMPVIKVTSAHPGDVISYLRAGLEYRPTVGETVLVRSRSGPREILTGVVQNIGPEYELIPPEQLRDPGFSEWGLPVKITLKQPEGLLPGEVVDVTFTRDR